VPSSEPWSLDAGEFDSPFASGGRRARTERALWLVPFFLSVLGIVMIASLTSQLDPAGTLYALPFRQGKFLAMGLFSMFVVYNIPSPLLRRVSGILWAAAWLLTWGTLIPGVGVRAGGAWRWLNLGFVQFQPLEMLALAGSIRLADRLSVTQRKGAQCFWSPTILLLGLSVLPLFFQPNMSGIVLISVICVSMHAVCKGWKYPLRGGFLLALFFAAMIVTRGYRWLRLLSFLDPWQNPQGGGYQIIQGLVAFSNGGIAGVGIGKGLQKLNYLPAAHTDYIFPVIGEEFGLIGTLAVVAGYALWTWKAYSLYRRSRDPYLANLLWGMAISVLFPMFVNLGGVMRLIPLTGIPLPFVSSGGTSLIFMWIRVGILMRAGKETFLRDEPDFRRQ
jgi:cell division protein FtsW